MVAGWKFSADSSLAAASNSLRNTRAGGSLLAMRAALTFALLCGADAAPGIGYSLEISENIEVASPRSRIGGIAGLQASGFTLSAWIKYYDTTPTVLMTEINLVSSADDNLFNGFGGPGKESFGFSTTHDFRSRLPDASAFEEWHHFALSFDAQTQVRTLFVDGVPVDTTVLVYSEVDTFAHDAALHLGMTCFHKPEGTLRSCFSHRVFQGQLDDVALFVGALSETEMGQRWNSSLTQRLADGLEPALAIFYDFNDPITTPGEIPNLGYAGSDFDLVFGQLDATATGRFFLATDDTEQQLGSPSVVATSPIVHKAAEPDSTPRVAYAAPGATVDLAAVLGMAVGQSYTAPALFNVTAVLSDVPVAEGGFATVHIVPLVAPEPLDSRWHARSTTEDQPLSIQLVSGPRRAWNEDTLRVIARPPMRGTLYQQENKEDRDLTRPLTAGAIVESSWNVLYVPETDAFGADFDSFSVYFRLNGTDDEDPTAGVYESAPFDITIDVLPYDDIPFVHDISIRIDEDSVGAGLQSGHEIVLQLSDAELGQVLAGHITRLPSKGTLYAVTDSGQRTPVNAEYNPFDVGSPVLRQYVARVVNVSSHWGGSPPYGGYHPLGIIGPPDCENNIAAMECTADQPWVGEPSRFPELGTHVLFNGHVGYVRGIHEIGSLVGGSEGALDLEMHQYYKRNSSDADGSWEPCHMDPSDPDLSYPAGCLSEAEGGGLNAAFGRPLLRTVGRSAISAFSAAVWSPRRQEYYGDLSTGGGMFGPEYVFSHLHSDYYRGLLPYTEYIEVAVATPVYMFGVVVGMPRGVGAIVAIRARDPSKEKGSSEEWVRMYEGEPLLKEYEKNREQGQPYWKWSPDVCRMHFLADTIRIEMDTSAATGASDWNYIDAVEILGSTSIQTGALRQDGDIRTRHGAWWSTNGSKVTSIAQLVYVPHANAHGDDSFEYVANDCTGDIFRVSEPGVVSITIDPVNDIPTLVVSAVNATTGTNVTLDFRDFVADVETDPSHLIIDITALPAGTASYFYDNSTLISPSTLPHRLTDGQKVLSFRFDSLAGLEISSEVDGELRRTLGTAKLGFAATDPDGGVLTSEVPLRLYLPSFSCVAPDHEVVFEGEQPICRACAQGRAARPGSSTCDICDEGYFRLTADDDTGSCSACPPFAASCPRGATLETMVLTAGWWRASSQSAEWHWCGEAPGHVRFLLLSWLKGNSPAPMNHSDTSAQTMCRGGELFLEEGSADSICAPNHAGPLCRSCDTSYFLSSQLACEECPEKGSVVRLISIVLVCGVVAAIAHRLIHSYIGRPAFAGRSMLALQWIDALLRFLCNRLHDIESIRSNAIFVPTFKLTIAYFQVAQAIPAVYDVSMPKEYYKIFDWLSFLRFNWLFELGVDPQCMGSSMSRLSIYGFTPLGLIFALPFLAFGLMLLSSAARFIPFVGHYIAPRQRARSHASIDTSTSRGRSRTDSFTGRSSACGRNFQLMERAVLRTLPVSLLVAFVVVIQVSHRIFAVFDCVTLETDSLSNPRESRQFVSSDLTLECASSSSEYRSVRRLAFVLMALWPVAMPLFFSATLFSQRKKLLSSRGSLVTKAISFLHKEYEPPFFWWEPVVLTQRIALSGWIQLVPGNMALVRIVLGLLISLVYTLLLMICKPYESIQVDILAIISQSSLVLLFIAAVLLKTYDLTEPAGIAYEVTGFRNKDAMTLLIIIVMSSILASFVIFLLHEMQKQATTKILRLVQNSQVPRLELEQDKTYHLFLSHVWSTAQDSAAIIKRMLTLLMPGISIFLDIDDLEDIGDLERYVDESQCVLIMMTRGYFTSTNCLRELDHSLTTKKPLVLLHEDDVSKGGAPLAKLRIEFEKHERDKQGFVVGERYRHDTRGPCTAVAYDVRTGVVEMEFDEPAGEVHRYRPSSQHKIHLLVDDGRSQAATIFDSDEIIAWQRIPEYQAISLRLIAEKMLARAPAYMGKPPSAIQLYLPNSIHRQELRLPRGTCVHVSENNPGARELADEIVTHLLSNRTKSTDYEIVPKFSSKSAKRKQSCHSGEVSSPERGNGSRQSLGKQESRSSISMTIHAAEALSARAAEALTMKGDLASVVEEAFVTRAEGLSEESIGDADDGQLVTHMLLLLNTETFRGDEGDDLCDEIFAARSQGIEVIMAHESDSQRGGCEFVHFFEVTPQRLISDGLYDKIAIDCKAEPYRQVSLSLIAKALGAKPANSTSEFWSRHVQIKRTLARVREQAKRARVARRAARAERMVAKPRGGRLAVKRPTTRWAASTKNVTSASPGASESMDEGSVIVATSLSRATPSLQPATDVASSQEQV